MTGTFKVYFNRHQAAPLVWCVHNGAIEIAFSEVRLLGNVRSVYKPKDTADEDDGIPSAWFETTGSLQIEGSVATIVGEAEGPTSWPTEHESDCPAVEHGDSACRCPLGNL